jgi:hypothetical protein
MNFSQVSTTNLRLISNPRTFKPDAIYFITKNKTKQENREQKQIKQKILSPTLKTSIVLNEKT